jgi:hypothetical protein
LGGDLLRRLRFGGDFVAEVLRPTFKDQTVQAEIVCTLLIPATVRGAGRDLLEEADGRGPPAPADRDDRQLPVRGLACLPPTPFALKDWERYDVSRYVDPGCVAPEAGRRTIPVEVDGTAVRTIEEDLRLLAADDPLDRTVFLFHSPPYQTVLDRASLDGVTVDSAPVDVHVGSVAIASFIEARQPLATLHGHVHESIRLTGAWHQRLGRTHLFGAAHDGPELAVVRFDLTDLDGARRDLICRCHRPGAKSLPEPGRTCGRGSSRPGR